jgi:hypothetical protein
VSGYTCFTIDEGSSQAEFTCGTVSGTSVTSLLRGISPATGTTTVSALQFSHRRGASVKITDYPLIQILKAQANGEDTYPNILRYASHPTFSATTDIVDKKYVDDTAFSGAAVIDATALARGVVELATGAEAAASTASGSSGVLALPASLATSTYNSLTAANRVVVTGGSGKIDNYFIATSTLFNNIGGVPYTWPSIQGAASTTLVNNGSGSLLWQGFSGLLAASSTPLSIVGGTGTTTLATVTIPANQMGTRNAYRFILPLTMNIPNTDTVYFAFGDGTSTTTSGFTNGSGGTLYFNGELSLRMNANNSTSAQYVYLGYFGLPSGISTAATARTSVTSAKSYDTTTLKAYRLEMWVSGGPNASTTGAYTSELIRE